MGRADLDCSGAGYLEREWSSAESTVVGLKSLLPLQEGHARFLTAVWQYTTHNTHLNATTGIWQAFRGALSRWEGENGGVCIFSSFSLLPFSLFVVFALQLFFGLRIAHLRGSFSSTGISFFAWVTITTNMT